MILTKSFGTIFSFFLFSDDEQKFWSETKGPSKVTTLNEFDGFLHWKSLSIYEYEYIGQNKVLHLGSLNNSSKTDNENNNNNIAKNDSWLMVR